MNETPDYEFLCRSRTAFVRRLVPGTARLAVVAVALLAGAAVMFVAMPLARQTSLGLGLAMVVGAFVALAIALPRAQHPLNTSRVALAGVVAVDEHDGKVRFRVVVGKAAADQGDADAARQLVRLTHTTPAERPPPYDRGPLPRCTARSFLLRATCPCRSCP
ncbi:MAG: hypothetical protein AB7K09_10930 [Planctomycetota bacterium]